MNSWRHQKQKIKTLTLNFFKSNWSCSYGFYEADKRSFELWKPLERSQQLKNKTRPYQASYQPVWATQLHDSVIMWIGAHTATVFRTILRSVLIQAYKTGRFLWKHAKNGFGHLKLKKWILKFSFILFTLSLVTFIYWCVVDFTHATEEAKTLVCHILIGPTWLRGVHGRVGNITFFHSTMPSHSTQVVNHSMSMIMVSTLLLIQPLNKL
jgi:hypothetical protein